ncbi:hypothetical protein GALL_356350 [mine drainage metagenome]|uniref:Uncharacterized protein n=1 Tax=mine drainage metagenome TaxID=410659 RepID=A0A1J5R333_9ZZZZ
MPKPLILGQLLEIEARIKQGLPIDEYERQQHAAAKEVFKSAIEDFQERYASIVEQCRPALIKLPDLFQQVGQWYKAISDRLAPVFAEMVVAFREMPPRLQSALLTLGENGWYLDGELGLSDLWSLEELLLDGQVPQVDSILTQHYEDRLNDIEGHLIAALPNREKIFRAAFAAHRRGEFELSVPVLLAQSDGACLDLTGYHLFMKDRATGKPKASLHVTASARDALSTAMLSPLANVLPINASEGDRKRRIQDQGLTDWRELNRHLVLHGESFDYGTQMNSLKAVSLINYLVGVLAKAGDGFSDAVIS